MKKLLKKLLARLRGEQCLDKLVKRGLVVGKDFNCMGEVIIDPSHCWHIKIGDHVTLAPRVHILAHDASTKIFLDYTRVANVSIGNNVFVGAGTTILPGVTIGNNVVIGAGSVVSHDIPDNAVAMGCPARVVKSIDEFVETEKQKMNPDNVFDDQFTLRNPDFDEKQKNILVESCQKHGCIFVK